MFCNIVSLDCNYKISWRETNYYVHVTQIRTVFSRQIQI
jgi:hypothetical protein